MNEWWTRVALAFCCLGMAVWPLSRECGCSCVTAERFAELLDEQCQSIDFIAAGAGDSDAWKCPVAPKEYEAIPNFVIKNFDQDHSLVESVFGSPFQGSQPGSWAMGEVVENLRAPRFPRHVMFCTILE